MKLHASETRNQEPRMIAERKPVRPVKVAVVRQPIKVVKPFNPLEAPLPSTVIPLRPVVER